jgi:hypothetical protein
MTIPMNAIPSGPDPRIVVAWIRACIWAGVEGRPFCPLQH